MEQTPELAFDCCEVEARTSIIESLSNTTVAEPEQQVTIGKENESRKETQKIQRPS